MNKILFILHPNQNSASNYVRAIQFCNNNFELSYFFEFINKKKIIQKITYLYRSLNLSIKCSSKYSIAIIIKPSSVLSILILLAVYKKKLYIDINDPLDQTEFLGYFRFRLLLFLFKNRIIYEFKAYCEKKYGYTGELIDDYSQYEDFEFPNWHERKNVILWFGDQGNSENLIRVIDLLSHMNSVGFVLNVVGLSNGAKSLLSKNHIRYSELIPKSRDDFLKILSESKFSIIPFDREKKIHTLRGNLKVKISMAAGCIVFAEKIPMHTRLINDQENGFLFDSRSLESFINRIKMYNYNFSEISKNATRDIKILGTRDDYRKKYLDLITDE